MEGESGGTARDDAGMSRRPLSTRPNGSAESPNFPWMGNWTLSGTSSDGASLRPGGRGTTKRRPPDFTRRGVVSRSGARAERGYSPNPLKVRRVNVPSRRYTFRLTTRLAFLLAGILGGAMTAEAGLESLDRFASDTTGAILSGFGRRVTTSNGAWTRSDDNLTHPPNDDNRSRKYARQVTAAVAGGFVPGCFVASGGPLRQISGPLVTVRLSSAEGKTDD